MLTSALAHASADPVEYSRYCGPQSLAAALDITPGTTARLLLDIMRQRGVIEVPGTSAETMVLGLYVLGVNVETYDPVAGEVRESNTQCIDRARRTAPHPFITKAEAREVFLELINSWPAEARPSAKAHVDDMFAFAKSLRLSDWLRFRGTWLLDVDTPDSPHWVALRDGAVLVSRDSTYWSCRIRQVLRLEIS